MTSSAISSAGIVQQPKDRARYEVVDLLRGLAILGVVFYHFAWDLSFLGFASEDVMFHPAWIAFARTLASSFLFLVGVSLVLAHGAGIRWRAFWRRLAILVLSAAAITLGTYFAFPESFVFFGILHAIALFSLLALPFLRAPLWLLWLLSLVILALPQLVQSDLFNTRILGWLGLWTVPPLANDLVPVFPSFGIVLLGVGAGRMALASPLRDRMASLRLHGHVSRMLLAIGRWTLVIYLVHQPILFGSLFLLAQIVKPQEAARAAAFTGSCEANCVGTQGEPGNCKAYCSCALEIITANNLWEAMQGAPSTPGQQEAISSIFPQCSARHLP